MKYYTLVFLLCIVGCQENKEFASDQIKLKEINSSRSGIDFTNQLEYTDEVNILEYLYYYNGGGVAIGDLNNDGLEDIYFTANQSSDKLYLNKGSLTFEDITVTAGIENDKSWSSGVTIEDINNDGFLDIFVCKVGNHKGLKSHNLVYLNNGDLTFTESSEKLGLNFSGYSTQAAFIDFDKDGDLDLYLLNHSVHTVRSYGTTKNRKDPAPLSGDRFYENRLNEKENSFVDVTLDVGIFSSPLGYGLAIKVIDINNDGWEDIFIGNDFHENDFVYINQKNKTFKESASEILNHSSRFTMGVDVEDINNDGLFDIFSTDMMPFRSDVFLKSGGEDTDKVDRIKKDFGFEPQVARNNLQLQNKNGTFSDVSLMTQTYATDWSWSVLLADFDNDMNKDIFITNGIVKRPNDLDYINYISDIKFQKYSADKQKRIRKEIIAEMPTLKIPNVLFKGLGDMKFSLLKDSFFSSSTFSNGAAVSDLDNDGDLDLVVNNINEKASLYENKTDKGGFLINLKHPDNKSTKGTRVELFLKNQRLVKTYTTLRGFQSSSGHQMHFGVPDVNAIDSLRVIWPDSTFQVLDTLGNSRSIEIEYPHFQNNYYTYKPYESTFQVSYLPFSYEENYYLDYERERLIPEKISEEGPAFLFEDLNGDNRKDIFIGGARTQPAEVWIAQKNGSFNKLYISDFLSDRNFEDVDVASIDIDLDGDRDLYVVSGGNDIEQEDAYLIDRIYLNNGSGQFKRGKVNLPATNGGTVAVADIDNDGVEDIFIGSRSIPGAYGLSPDSYLLRNNSGKGLEAVVTYPFGMVTDAKWVDIDNDQRKDLILAGDWMPITILKNMGGFKFKDLTQEKGLNNSYGMWNTIEVFDFDKDGKLDIVGGNVGENFKWKPSVSNPVKLYLDDFDENNQLDPIIFYNFFGSNVPFASKDKLGEQIPLLKKKFTAYKKFATVDGINKLFKKDVDSLLLTKQINELRSMIYLQKEDGFTGIPLPFEAQQSSIEGIHIDERGTLSYVGNYFGHVIELGPQDANPGGQLIDFNPDSATFSESIKFGLPKSIAAKSIEKLNPNSYVITTQNNYILYVEKSLQP